MDFTYSFPAVKGIQAGREYYITMIPLKYLVKLLPEPIEYIPPEFRAQRRLNESRIPEIKSYILENRASYIFSSLTASIDGKFSFQESKELETTGLLKISMGAKMLINDGQHRRAAIAQALVEDETLEDETISVVFFEDRGLEKSQQMFTDLNMNAQKSSNSINTCFETRDPLAVLTKEIVRDNPFLNKYTDLEKDNLGKNSSKLFTLYTIFRVNRKIVGSSDVTFEDERFLYSFWNSITSNIPELQELESRVITKATLREEYVVTLGVTLLSFSRVGIWLYQAQGVNVEKYLKKLSKVDWSRSNPAWNGRIIREDGKIMTNENAIILAGNYLKKCLGIALSKDEEKREELMINESKGGTK